MAGKVSERLKPHAALDLDPLIHERARLAILSALGSQGELSFTELKALTGTTDGNLSAHTAKLEQAGYIEAAKGMLGGRQGHAGRPLEDDLHDHRGRLPRALCLPRSAGEAGGRGQGLTLHFDFPRISA